MQRRNLLRTAAIAGGAATLTAGGMALAESGSGNDEDGSPTFVFVSGSNGTNVTFNGLGLNGLRSVAAELPGHGTGHFPVEYQAPQDLESGARQESPLKDIGLDDYVAAAVETVRTVAEFGPVILIGMSMGGAVVSRVGNEVPDLVDHMVYDTAICCVDLPSIAEYFATPEGSTSLAGTLADWAVGDPEETGASRTNWRSSDPGFIAAAKEALFGDGTDEELLSMMATLQPDESASVVVEDASGKKDTWGTIPRTYIRHTLDNMIPIALQDRFIAEADALTPDNRFAVHTVETSHVGTKEAHDKVLKILIDLA